VVIRICTIIGAAAATTAATTSRYKTQQLQFQPLLLRHALWALHVVTMAMLRHG